MSVVPWCWQVKFVHLSRYEAWTISLKTKVIIKITLADPLTNPFTTPIRTITVTATELTLLTLHTPLSLYWPVGCVNFIEKNWWSLWNGNHYLSRMLTRQGRYDHQDNSYHVIHYRASTIYPPLYPIQLVNGDWSRHLPLWMDIRQMVWNCELIAVRYVIQLPRQHHFSTPLSHSIHEWRLIPASVVMDGHQTGGLKRPIDILIGCAPAT